METKEKEIRYDLEQTRNPQIKALQELGFEYIIVGSQKKRIYAFVGTEVMLLKDYAKYNGIALNSSLFPNFIIDRLKIGTFYKI